MSKDTSKKTIFFPVSYTHLDVYKRQIPRDTVEDLQKIGVNTSSGTSGSPAYYPATVNGYTYKEANADGTGEGTAPLTFSPSANYILMADIDLAATPATGSNAPTDAANWTPIGGTSISFTGRFNGNGHTIKGMKVSSSNDAYIGFFRSLSGLSLIHISRLTSPPPTRPAWRRFC